MKTVMTFLVVVTFTMASPLYADTVTLIAEDFESGASHDLYAPIAGTNGWTGDSSGSAYLCYYPSVPSESGYVDSGYSAGPTGDASGSRWAGLQKGFTAPTGVTSYTLTATLYAPSTNYGESYAQVDLISPNGRTYMANGFGNLLMGRDNVGEASDVQVTVPVDVKMFADDNGVDFYQRVHGTTDWTLETHRTWGAGDLANFNAVGIDSFNNYYGNIDSVVLTATYVVPEPAAVALLLSGTIGLLAYAWRKRK
jgi:hypothetical protein